VESVGVRLGQITDGLSTTILAGEKHVPKKFYGVGYLDNCTYNGDYPQCYTRGAGEGVGIALDLKEETWKWGSSHLAVCQFVFCDGSVQSILKSIDPEILGLLCIRDDGQVIPPYE
jgi:hypothetical protein